MIETIAPRVKSIKNEDMLMLTMIITEITKIVTRRIKIVNNS